MYPLYEMYVVTRVLLSTSYVHYERSAWSLLCNRYTNSFFSLCTQLFDMLLLSQALSRPFLIHHDLSPYHLSSALIINGNFSFSMYHFTENCFVFLAFYFLFTLPLCCLSSDLWLLIILVICANCFI